MPIAWQRFRESNIEPHSHCKALDSYIPIHYSTCPSLRFFWGIKRDNKKAGEIISAFVKESNYMNSTLDIVRHTEIVKGFSD